MAGEISVTIKFFSGLNRDLGLQEYDPAAGIALRLKPGVRLRTVLRGMGMRKLSWYAFFRRGERISPWRKLRDGDEVSCLKPSGGG